MSLRLLSRLPRSLRPLGSRSMGGSGGPSPPLPPFARNLAPTKTLHEEHEVVWDDGVAPELTLDFDAQHISKKEGGLWWLAGLAFFASLFGLCKLNGPEGMNPAVNRVANIIPDKVVMEDAASEEDGDEAEDDE